MTDQEKALLRAIILSHEPRVEAKVYADWLDEELRGKEAAKFRRARKPKSAAFARLGNAVAFRWLAESPAIATTWESFGEARSHARYVARETGLPAKGVLIDHGGVGRDPEWGVLIAGSWYVGTHKRPSLWLLA